MSDELSLQQAERRSFRLSLQNGLLDIQIGLSLLALSAAALFAESGSPTMLSFGIAIAATFLLVGVLALVRRGLITPRLGRVIFGQTRRRKINALHWIVVAAVAVTTLTVLGAHLIARNNPDFASKGAAIWGIVIFFAIVIFGVFVGLTFFLDEPRLMIYGVLVTAAVPIYFAIQEYTDISVALPFFIVGALILGMGLFLLIRFLREYPPAPDNFTGLE